ncbi:hypothetical protein CALVIDRAFT_556866 [Calocera viscosa TUFC12733]|uniref:Uncharacterized protein n=1 Tax=Calocera viscosa (strain TUFC12733) TaxID=1330018 RepID=A0A167JJ14_CALVF|nr:hypothetical protein CALVIDRAFT_556866 [Calocera viscosa TUFC12733]
MAVMYDEGEDDAPPTYEYSKAEQAESSGAARQPRISININVNVHLNTYYTDAGTAASDADARTTFYPTPAASTDGFARGPFYNGTVNTTPKQSKLFDTLNMFVHALPFIFFILSLVLVVGLPNKPDTWLILLITFTGFETVAFFLTIMMIGCKLWSMAWAAFESHRLWAWPAVLLVRLGAWAAIIALMFLAHPSCSPNSAWFQSFVPSHRLPGGRQTPQQTGQVKCVVSMIELTGAFVLCLSCTRDPGGDYPLLS